MDIPANLKWELKNPEMKMKKENVKNIILHHFAFVPDNKPLMDLSKSEAYNVYYKRPADYSVSIDGGEQQDYLVPYHYIIDKDSNGKFRYTKVVDTSFCTGHDGFNYENNLYGKPVGVSTYRCDSISIAIAGDYRSTEFEPELKKIIEELSLKLTNYFPIENFAGHREIDNTTCPTGHPFFKQFKEDIQNKISSKLNADSNPITYASVTRYVKTGKNDPWYFRNHLNEYKGYKGFYPSNDEERRLAYENDFRINCQGSCDVGASGKIMIPGEMVACDPQYKFGTKFTINGKTFVCTDRGGAIKNHKRGGKVAIDIMVPKDQYDAYEKYTGVHPVVITY